MKHSSNNSAVLWTGGKDCALAYQKALQAGYNITHLVTFVPKNPNFAAHSLELMQQQIEAIGLPHIKVLVEKPMKESYEEGIQKLMTDYNIHRLITGDIDTIENHSNWIEDCCQKSGMKVFNPLWKKNRKELLQELIHSNFEVIFTLVKKPFFTAKWIGEKINNNAIEALKLLEIDLCGENGEYHTMVLNAPFFNQKIQLNKMQSKETEHYYYLETCD